MIVPLLLKRHSEDKYAVEIWDQEKRSLWAVIHMDFINDKTLIERLQRGDEVKMRMILDV
jgi:hypothetical protein